MSWPQLVGYQHEVLQTGVLKYLFDDKRHEPGVVTAVAGAR
jgi:hypothetical protein